MGIKLKLNKKHLTAYLFIGPAVSLIGIFYVFPLFFALFVSLFKWRIKPVKLIYWDNYLQALGPIWLQLLAVLVGIALYLGYKKIPEQRGSTPKRVLNLVTVIAVIVFFSLFSVWGDQDFFASLRVTFWYSLGTVPVQVGAGFLLAVILDQRFKGKQIFRVFFLLPYIVPSVATAAVFERIFSLRPESFANTILSLFGLEPLQWLQETKGIFELLLGWSVSTSEGWSGYWQSWASGPSLALITVMIFNWWIFTGYYTLIYSNGLVQIPRQLYEAAELDGASFFQKIRYIMIPLVKPVTLFLTMLGIIGTFKAFNHIYVLRRPGVRSAIDTMSINIFFTFFRKSRFGYAAALSMILLLVVIGLTKLQQNLLGKESRRG
ncbi:carbohydrate ABC transporter permease [Spirochaeta cellobiosiphila]|uniref:carbohydrate ABC transporter permease n=1 Tax=Spirochaeta cellobiosiphila TaxID=504483 RepID=UPI00069F3092|nr:sugar ABC transporter permease [Spirochaeta cellobiosiphila]